MEVALIVLGLIGAIASIIGIEWYRANTRRQEAARFFLSRGFNFTPEHRSPEDAGRGGFSLFAKRRLPKVYNLGERSMRYGRISIFNYDFSISTGKNRKTVYFTVAEVRTAAPLPVCTVQAETILSKIAQVVGYDDIDFAHDPEFSKQFVVRGAEPARISEMCTAEVREFFKTFPDLNFESGPDGFIWYTPGRLKVAQYDGMVTRAEQLAQILTREH